jgi:predicted metal-dependent hydrolase
LRKAASPQWLPLEQAVPIDLFRAEVEAWARTLGVTPREVCFRPMKRKWSSCSSRGRLTFDTDLLRQPAEFRREVIVHELLHLKVPNHGKSFKALLKAYLASAETASFAEAEKPFVNGVIGKD